MVSARNNQIESSGVYRVRDTKSILFTLIVGIVLGLLAFNSNREWVHNNFPIKDDEGSILIFNLLLLGASCRLKAIWDGVKLDLEEGTIEFPGGGVAANDMSDYIKLDFLLQYLKRTRVYLDQVSYMVMDSKTSRTWSKDSGQYYESTKYYIRLSGTFGAASIPFLSEGKRNELYTAIRQLNRMGEPVFMS